MLLAAAASPGLAAVDFHADVRPILSDRCYTCHGPDEATRMSPLRLDVEEGAFGPLAGGGFAIVRGKPGESELIRRVEASAAGRRMPPAALGHEPLSADEIATLRAWVREGAPWSRHWAFVPPRKRPAAGRTDPWIANPVDRFVLARLREEGMEPSAEAGRATLLRRVTLDLTGVPPTPGEVAAFLGDASPGAYSRVVERLLASPRFGERMAFRWLDAARYADTNGYQNDRPRDMWRWRDWVIEAFNANMPFDRFTVEQLAGDLLPDAALEQRIATGFNRNHRGNAENGTDPDEYQVEYAVDRLETTATVWLGLTVGCARCHDHKYDPISQREFYQFYAYFNNVSDRGRYYKYGNTPPTVHAPTREQQERLARLDRRIEGLEAALEARADEIERGLSTAAAAPGLESWAYAERLAARRTFDDAGAEAAGRRGRAAALDGRRHFDLGDVADLDFYDPFTIAAWIRPEAGTGGIVSRYKADGPRGFGLFLVGGRLQLRIDTASISDRMRIESAAPLRLGQWTHVAGVYDGSRTTRGMRLYVDGSEVGAKTLVDESLNATRSPAPLRIGHGPAPEDRFRGAIDDARVYLRALSGEEAAVLAVAESPGEIAAVPSQARTAAQQRKLRWAYLAEAAPEDLSATWAELRRARLEREDFVASLPTVMVMEERADVRPTHVLFRGSFDAPRERVEPGLPSALPPLPAGLPNNRLGLARWLTDPSHPLTARVTVNRFWQMLFGRGIVATVEDFGSQGAAPSHPGLLDWLAAEFVESGWDVKGLLRTIVTSATYRQSSQVSPEALERDPENLLLARAPRERLPAEAIRDQALAVAGLLSPELGGPSVKPYQPGGLWKELSNWGAYENDHGGDLYRRSLYTYWKRTLGPPAMLAFDAAPRETCVVREVRTNTPVQALTLMNDPTYNEAARLLAERMLREGGATDRERLGFGFLLATAREPGAAESSILRSSLNRYRDRYRTDPEDAERYLAVGEYERDASVAAPELAAYAAVASMLLNLDETITRE